MKFLIMLLPSPLCYDLFCLTIYRFFFFLEIDGSFSQSLRYFFWKERSKNFKDTWTWRKNAVEVSSRFLTLEVTTSLCRGCRGYLSGG
jgi:hypothetical protein